MATTYLTRTLGTPTNNKIWTFSAWIKKCDLAAYQNFFAANSARDCIRFNNDDTIQMMFNEASSGTITTSRKFRDTNGYFHVVWAVDTTQATAANRVKLYINGVQETSFSTETYPAQNYTCFINSAIEHRIGKDFTYVEYFGGIMSHVHFCDGTQLAPTVFGETDATTGEWKIKTSPSFTLGTNGFTILKDGNTITDQSTNSNNWTLGGGTLTNTEDCPDDVFCTLNPLAPITTGSLSYGNTRIVGTVSTNYGYNTVGSLGDSKGKYYCEIKYTVANANTNCTVGVVNLNNHEPNVNTTSATGGYVAFRLDGTKFINGSSTAGYWATPTAGDIVMIALDMDNLKVWVGLNGSWYGTTGNTDGNPATGANPSATITAGVFSPVNIRHLAGTFDCNFGNGYFGTTAITSEGTNASGIGKFEYDVPTNFTALSLKGMNS